MYNKITKIYKIYKLASCEKAKLNLQKNCINGKKVTLLKFPKGAFSKSTNIGIQKSFI